jgi:hypothetical protein
MKTLASLLIITIFSILPIKVFAAEDKLIGTWSLDVNNLNNRLITTLEIKFTADKAKSCLGGSWRKIEVISSTPEKNSFYPDSSMILNQELSYKLDNAVLTIGRNNICDAYKHLTGELKEYQAIGKYIGFGWERKELGTFKLHRTST